MLIVHLLRTTPEVALKPLLDENHTHFQKDFQKYSTFDFLSRAVLNQRI